jgi:hypothetical protein
VADRPRRGRLPVRGRVGEREDGRRGGEQQQ